jgi:dTDP-4-dehydrorhamnose 3,5-epimerase-like enzyme
MSFAICTISNISVQYIQPFSQIPAMFKQERGVFENIAKERFSKCLPDLKILHFSLSFTIDIIL